MPGIQRTACLCGKSEATSFGVKDEIELIRCACGVVRRAELDLQDYVAQYMSGFYHNDHIDTSVALTINDRFQHDLSVAFQRLRKLSLHLTGERLPMSHNGSPPLSPDVVLLDVGCGNGAFVAAALQAGYDAHGIDLYLPQAADPLRRSGRVEVSELADCRFARRTVDVLVLNDVLEHLANPLTVLQQAEAIVKRDGLIVIDTPQFTEHLSIENHHVKPNEHVWYATPEAWLRLFAEAQLDVVAIDHPIQEKIVFYLRPNDRVIDLIARGPTGLGDIHWVLLKLGALKRAEMPCRLSLLIPGNGDPALIFRSKGFLDLVPFIDESKIEIGPPVIIDSGSDDVTKPIYTLIANGHLERGRRIEEWYPQFEVDFDYPVVVAPEDQQWAQEICDQVGRHLVVFYGSSKAWNHTISGKNWTIKDWTALTQACADQGIVPVWIGKHWDRDFSSAIGEASTAKYLDLTGKTTEGQALALFQRAAAVVGMCAGITILAVHMKARSIVFWPEHGKGVATPMQFNREFARDWVDPGQIERGEYVPLSLGTFGVKEVVAQLETWGVLR